MCFLPKRGSLRVLTTFAMTSGDDYTILREELLEHIYDEEHSDLPVKIYRVYTVEDPQSVVHLTITSKTQLGAVIAFADWDYEHGKYQFPLKYWRTWSREWNNQDIDEYAKILIRKLFDEQCDDVIVELTEVIYSPFSSDTTKSALKHDKET